jgi:hypothetical protein
MITENNILDIIDECKKKGYGIRVRDIAYVFLCEHFADRSIAYRSLNGNDGVNVDLYHDSPEITFLRDHIKYNVERKQENSNRPRPLKGIARRFENETPYTGIPLYRLRCVVACLPLNGRVRGRRLNRAGGVVHH